MMHSGLMSFSVRWVAAFVVMATAGWAQTPGATEAPEPNERLMISELKENELVLIDYYSVSHARTIGRQYMIRGGEPKVLTANRNIVEVRNRVPHVVNKYLLGDLVLAPDEVLGLESLLVFYAARVPGNCGTRDIIQVEFYRDGKRVGLFTYRDETCFTTAKDAESTRARTRGKVDDLIMDSLMPFKEFDDRIRAAEAARER
jgi:hypothetical protein